MVNGYTWGLRVCLLGTCRPIRNFLKIYEEGVIGLTSKPGDSRIVHVTVNTKIVLWGTITNRVRGRTYHFKSSIASSMNGAILNKGNGPKKPINSVQKLVRVGMDESKIQPVEEIGWRCPECRSKSRSALEDVHTSNKFIPGWTKRLEKIIQGKLKTIAIPEETLRWKGSGDNQSMICSQQGGFAERRRFPEASVKTFDALAKIARVQKPERSCTTQAWSNPTIEIFGDKQPIQLSNELQHAHKEDNGGEVSSVRGTRRILKPDRRKQHSNGEVLPHAMQRGAMSNVHQPLSSRSNFDGATNALSHVPKSKSRDIEGKSWGRWSGGRINYYDEQPLHQIINVKNQ